MAQSQPIHNSGSKNSSQAKLNKVQDEATDFLSEAKEKGAEYLSQAKDSVNEYVEQGSDSVRGWIKDAGGMLSSAEKGVRNNIKRHPLEAVLIGLGIGCAIGFFVNLARRD